MQLTVSAFGVCVSISIPSHSLVAHHRHSGIGCRRNPLVSTFPTRYGPFRGVRKGGRITKVERKPIASIVRGAACSRVMTPLAFVALLLVIISTAHGALRTWDGEGANNFWMTGANWGVDLAPVAGDDLLFPPGAARLFNSNNFPAGTIFNSVTFAGGGYTLRGSLVTLTGA